MKGFLRTLLDLVVIIWLMKSGIECLAASNDFNITSSKNSKLSHHHNNIHDDESSLLALKDWITNTMLSDNWTKEAHFCSWMGVTCSRRHPLRVTALNLSYMGLSGTIPEEIGNLSFLSYLNIRNNSFSGPIPTAIGKLRRLRALHMNYNELSGPIPPSLFNVSSLQKIYLGVNQLSGNSPGNIGESHLPNLQILSVSRNELVGTIPSGMFNLSSLQELYLYSNQLSGTLPKDIGDYMPKLQNLDLSENQLSGILPDSMLNLSSLQKLYLYSNQLSGNLPGNIGESHLPNLQILSVSRNELVGTILSGIFNLSSLQELYLYSNQFSGTLPKDIGDYMPKLQYLYLSENQLSGTIPMHIGKLSRLQTLYLHTNHLTGIIPASIFNLSKLEELSLSYNSFHGRVPSEINQLSNLNLLSLDENKLSGEIPTSLYNLSKLQVLSLPDNNLSGELPSSIATGLPILKELYIAGNRFSGAIPSSISNLSHLTGLDISDNSFSGYIPVNLGNLSNLDTISMSGNHFTNNLSIPEQDFLTPLAICKYLKGIEFGDNPTIAGELPKSFFSSGNLFATLEMFHASSCAISGEIPTEISNLNSLISLDLSNNTLVGAILESFQRLEKLQQLVLNDNILQGSIRHSICSMRSLYLISLSRNKLSGPMPLCLGTDLRFLKEIYLSGNELNSTIPFSSWINSGILKMYLDHNFFQGDLSPEMGNLKSLTELSISGNQLSGNIPDSVSVGQLQSLMNLSISNNRLDGSIPNSLSNLKDLKHLDLSHNNLSGPIPYSLTSLSYLEYLNVSFNHLSGEIPNEGPFRNFTDESFVGNKDLCGVARFKVDPCKLVNIGHSHKSRLILRYILPSVLAFSVIVGITIVFFIIKYHHRKSLNASSLLSDLTLGYSWERISYYDILQATRNFDEANLIGRGSFGSVYKGIFSHSEVVAVKVFNLETQGALRSFDDECQILRGIRHRNLVKVITSCSNLDFKALVLEYMPNGNLDKWIHSIDCSLNIFQRFRIMIDVATALEYLHHGCSTPIIHCDLKPSNILLDNDMVAHLGDLGIAKLLTTERIMQQTKTLGTIGYMAPEFGSGGFVSTATDVYGYGILVLETFTRKKPTDDIFSEGLTMKKWVSESFSESIIQNFHFELLNIDRNTKVIYERCLILIIALALECLADDPGERPSMNEVARKLGKIKVDLMLL